MYANYSVPRFMPQAPAPLPAPVAPSAPGQLAPMPALPMVPMPARLAALASPPPPPPLATGSWSAPGWAPPPTTTAPVQPVPGANEPIKAGQSFGALAMLDLANILAHPIQTVKSLFVVTRDLIGLQGQKGLTIASSAPAVAKFQQACQDLEAAPFKHLLPFYDKWLNSWAEGRFEELRPQVQSVLGQRAWHPVALEWPDGGTGRDRLLEVLMLNNVAQTATDGQIVRGLMGTNHVQFKDSTALDYFYPLGRAGDALILRRNLPILPGQKPLADTLKGYLNQEVMVHADV